jgi:hypothetical protein
VKSENHRLTAFKNGSYPALFIAHYRCVVRLFLALPESGILEGASERDVSRMALTRVTCADYEAMSAGQT